MTIPQVDLWAALAIEPIGDEHARAQEEVWGTVRVLATIGSGSSAS